MKRLSTILAILALSAVAAIGCGKKKDGATSVANVPANCSQAGQLYSSQYNSCLVQSNQCQSGYGWYSGTNSCVAGVPWNGNGGGYYGYPNGGGAYGQNYWIGSMTINDRQTYQDLLRQMGMCSRYDWNFGSEKCKRYSQGGRIELQVSGSTVQIRIVSSNSSAAYTGPASIYNGWIPNGYANPGSAPAAYAPLVFSATLGTENSNLAFQSYNGLRGYFNTSSLQRNMSVQLYYGSVPFATSYLQSPGY